MLTDQNWIQEIMHKGDKAHLFIFFENLDCKECRKNGKVMSELAKHTQGSP